jgi:tetratricopeptide (TPR) repeat protein
MRAAPKPVSGDPFNRRLLPDEDARREVAEATEAGDLTRRRGGAEISAEKTEEKEIEEGDANSRPFLPYYGRASKASRSERASSRGSKKDSEPSGSRAIAVALAIALLAWPVWTAVGQPPAAEAILRHAVELHQAGDVEGAIREYRSYLKQAPANAMARSNLGAALARAGRYDEAIAEYRQALKQQPDNLPVRLNLGLAYYKAAEISQAATEIAKVVGKQPENRQATLLLADCDLRLGENKKVIELLSPIEKESPDDKAVIYLLGTALIRDEQTARGQLLVDRILRDGDSAEARLLLGATKMNVRDFAGALEDLKKSVELNPSLPDVYSYYGMALAATGDTPGAAVAFQKELESNPNDFDANLQLGVLRKQEQNYEDARRCFERALGVRPGHAAVRYQLATLDLLAGDTGAARVKLEQLTKEAPQFVEAHVSLATVYYRLQRKQDGDRERAIVLKLNAEKQAAEPGAKPR